MDPVRLGIVGCGRLTQRVHLPALRGVASARVVALAEPDDGRRAEATARVPAAKAYAHADELYAADEVEAVLIALPNHLHVPAATAALAAGKAVYLEKPIANRAEDAQPLVEAWRASGLVGMIGFNYRRHPLIIEAKRRVEGGDIGEPVMARTLFASAKRDLPPWKARRETGGGALLDLASHHVDLLGYLLDSRVAAVAATLRSVHSEQDVAMLTLRFESGIEAHIAASISAADADRIDLIGDGGMLSIDRLRSRRLEHQGPSRPKSRGDRLRVALGKATDARDAAAPPAEPSHALALDAFCRAVREGDVGVQPDLAAGLSNLRILEAAERSAQDDGQFVPIKHDVDPLQAEA